MPDAHRIAIPTAPTTRPINVTACGPGKEPFTLIVPTSSPELFIDRHRPQQRHMWRRPGEAIEAYVPGSSGEGDGYTQSDRSVRRQNGGPV